MNNAKLPPPADYDENPEWTEQMIRNARPAAEMLREHLGPAALAEALRPRGRPRAEAPKEPVTMRLDRDVLRHYRARGRGWQTHINAILREHMDRARTDDADRS